MTVQTINLQLPEGVYQRLQRMADATSQSLEDVVLQTIHGNLPPSLNDLSPELQHVVTDLQSLNDAALWAIAREQLPPQQWHRHQRLLRKAHTGSFTAADQQELTGLREVTDRFVLRRSYALALLKWRGHTLPTDV